MKISSKNVIYEALKHNCTIKEIFVLKNENEGLRQYAEKNKVRVKDVDKKFMDKEFGKNNQGVGAYVEEFEYTDLDTVLEQTDNPNLIILDGIEDPHNLGAIIRSANASGTDAVIIPKDRSATVNPTVVRVSTGAVYSTKIVIVNNINRVINQLKDRGIQVIGTDAGGDSMYTDIDFKLPTATVIGSEGKGMRKMVKKNCDKLVKIPMVGSITSLNASVSSSLFMYELFRQRNT